MIGGVTAAMLARVQRLLGAEVYALPPSGAERARLVRLEGYLIRRIVRGCEWRPSN